MIFWCMMLNYNIAIEDHKIHLKTVENKIEHSCVFVFACAYVYVLFSSICMYLKCKLINFICFVVSFCWTQWCACIPKNLDAGLGATLQEKCALMQIKKIYLSNENEFFFFLKKNGK